MPPDKQQPVSLLILEVSLAFLLLHRTRFIVVDEATLSFRTRGNKSLFDDVRDRCSRALVASGQRVTAERSKPRDSCFGLFPWIQTQSVVVHYDPLTAALHHRPWLSKVEQRQRNVLAMDVQPYIQFGPV